MGTFCILLVGLLEEPMCRVRVVAGMIEFSMSACGTMGGGMATPMGAKEAPVAILWNSGKLTCPSPSASSRRIISSIS